MNTTVPTDPETTKLGWNLAVLALAIFANAFFAASEIAVISLNKTKIRKQAEDGDPMSARLLNFIEDPGKFLATIQVGVTLAGFLASAFAAMTIAKPIADTLAAQSWCTLSLSTTESIVTIAVTIALSFIMLIFGELVPKRIAMRYSEGLSRFAARPLKYLSTVSAPFVSLLNFSTNGILRMLKIDPEFSNDRVSEEEIRMMVDIGGENGAIEPQEKEMIENVFEFNNKTALEIMVHRKDIMAIPYDIGEADCRERIRKCGFSRIPVYNGTIDNIQGILNTRDYLIKALDDLHPQIADLMRKPFFVPETIRTDLLFRQMQKNKQSIAIVLDEFGGTSGIVSIEDLLEEIVGEIYDEYDVNISTVTVERISETEFRMPGETEIDVAAEELDVEIEEGDFNTIGGFVFEKLNRVPAVGTKLELPELFLEITVEKMDGQRVDSILVHKLEKPEPPHQDDEEDD